MLNLQARKRTRSSMRVAALVGLCAIVRAGIATASEPQPGDNRMSLEASVSPQVVSAPDTPLMLCVQNVNRRTASGQALVPGDSWTFRLEGGGIFSPLTTCA